LFGNNICNYLFCDETLDLIDEIPDEILDEIPDMTLDKRADAVGAGAGAGAGASSDDNTTCSGVVAPIKFVNFLKVLLIIYISILFF
jgi:hypothetical protein